jgi:hypothetical protein
MPGDAVSFQKPNKCVRETEQMHSSIGTSNQKIAAAPARLGRGGLLRLTVWLGDGELADGAFHLKLDEAVEFDGIFHREFLSDRLDEAVDDHGVGFVLGEAATHQVE